MLPKTFLHNKKIYLAYNNFRKKIFSELAHRDSEAILYLLPWMLSVNDPAVAGYVPNLKKPIAVFGATTDRTLIGRESVFKTMFGIKRQGSLLKPSTRVALIQGIYTIGSAGTISQTASSDCDIWICINKADFEDNSMDQLSQKIYLIKDWMDANLRMPVFFFISDIEDVRNSNFGTMDDESSGSAQRNVLKEEFYRTMIMIAGKIPLWWLCFDPHDSADYQAFCDQYFKGVFADYDCFDMGALESVDSNEYFGATLWQFNKALTHPLKSIIKMLLLEMLLVSAKEELLCHRFRNKIMNQENDPVFVDPSMFTLDAVLQYKQGTDEETFGFIKKCCYLRYDIKFFSKKLTIKETLARDIFLSYPLLREDIYRLNEFSAWPLLDQLDFGEKILILLINVYKDIAAYQQGITNEITPRDMTTIGRKLAACLEKKQNKVPVVHKPLFNLNLPTLVFGIDKKVWQVFAAGDLTKPVISSPDIVYCMSYLTWNDLFPAGDIRMTPNPTPVTLQEITNLAKRMREIFGAFDVTKVDFENYLESEKVTKMLVVISFEGSHHAKDMNDFCVIYSNHWGELFVRRFNSPEKMKEFIESGGQKFARTEMYYYIQRNSLYYEKIIERTKQLVTRIFSCVVTTLDM